MTDVVFWLVMGAAEAGIAWLVYVRYFRADRRRGEERSGDGTD